MKWSHSKANKDERNAAARPQVQCNYFTANEDQSFFWQVLPLTKISGFFYHQTYVSSFHVVRNISVFWDKATKKQQHIWCLRISFWLLFVYHKHVSKEWSRKITCKHILSRWEICFAFVYLFVSCRTLSLTSITLNYFHSFLSYAKSCLKKNHFRCFVIICFLVERMNEVFHLNIARVRDDN